MARGVVVRTIAPLDAVTRQFNRILRAPRFVDESAQRIQSRVPLVAFPAVVAAPLLERVLVVTAVVVVVVVGPTAAPPT